MSRPAEPPPEVEPAPESVATRQVRAPGTPRPVLLVVGALALLAAAAFGLDALTDHWAQSKAEQAHCQRVCPGGVVSSRPRDMSFIPRATKLDSSVEKVIEGCPCRFDTYVIDRSRPADIGRGE